MAPFDWSMIIPEQLREICRNHGERQAWLDSLPAMLKEVGWPLVAPATRIKVTDLSHRSRRELLLSSMRFIASRSIYVATQGLGALPNLCQGNAFPHSRA
jgi:hypothetical protein